MHLQLLEVEITTSKVYFIINSSHFTDEKSQFHLFCPQNNAAGKKVPVPSKATALSTINPHTTTRNYPVFIEGRDI
jgi:hypothetical protein